MSRTPSSSRRRFLRGLSRNLALAGTLPVVGSILRACGRGDARPTTPVAGLVYATPQLLATRVEASGSQPVRSFSGMSAPQNLELLAEDGSGFLLHDHFPRDNCPFPIDTSARLEDFALSTLDRTLAGELPAADSPRWALNMIPFGVAIDGVLLDPSGPWHEDGPPDPENPFDRACSGWEYDPIHPVVAELVGVVGGVHGHVQPGPGARPGSAGLFHYHGVPELMLENLRHHRDPAEALVVGYSADGYWIVDDVLAGGSVPLHLFSGYVLRETRSAAIPHTNAALVPGGAPDGLYVQDWVYDPEAKRAEIEAALARSGEYLGLRAAELDAGRAAFRLLDHRNGLTLEDFDTRFPGAGHPRRAYVYGLTRDWPHIPRWFAAEPAESFRNNIIPFASPAGPMMGPPGRVALYEACDGDLAEVHRWEGRDPY